MKITIDEAKSILFGGEKLIISDDVLADVERCYEFLRSFSQDKIIYGINTGFGPMAQWRIDDAHLEQLQYNIIRSHSTGAGQALSVIDVKAAMLARVGSLLQAKSGVHSEVVRLLQAFINRDIIPYIPQHGSVGASGDLVQLAHLALCLIGEGRVYYENNWYSTSYVLKKENLSPIKIYIREGLSITNGTSVMTGLSLVNQLHAENLLRLSLVASVWINEIVASYDDFISEGLNAARRHYGQIYVAEQMRAMSASSRRLQKREHCLYEGEHKEAVFEKKVQEYYSLRCVPQILGPIKETLDNGRRIIEEEMNAASDNPIVDYEAKNVFHGGNFHGDYISLEADKEKIAMTRLVMLAERQLNYLFHSRINGQILPPFLNDGVLGLNYGMQACQFTATSTTAECQTLAMPNYVHSIPNNNDNQDVVSMGTNSALLFRQVIENAYQVLAIHFMALAQATDILTIQPDLSSTCQQSYSEIRQIVDHRKEDKPFYEDIEKMVHYLKSKI